MTTVVVTDELDQRMAGDGEAEGDGKTKDDAPKSDKAPRVSRPRRAKPVQTTSDDGHDSTKESDEVEAALAEQDRIEAERRAAEERIAQMRKDNLLRLESALGIAEDRVVRLRTALGRASNGAANAPADGATAHTTTRRARTTSAPARRVSKPKPAKAKSPKATGRLPRRSAEDVARTLAEVVAAIQKAGNDGMRAEQIRAVLGMNANELPRILKAGLEDKTLRSKGQKRATTYFVK